MNRRPSGSDGEDWKVLLARRARRRLGHAPAVVLFAQVAHVAGDASVAVALAKTLFFDVPVGEARTEVALYLALAFAPYALLAPVATGVFAQWQRAHGAVIVGTDIGRAVLAAVLMSHLTGLLLYPLGFLLLVASRVHTVSLRSLIPDLLGRRGDLLDANASVSIASAVAGIAGAGLAFLIAGVAGSGAALLVASVLFAAGSLTGLWLAPPTAMRRRSDTDAAPRPPRPGDQERLVRRLVASLVAARAALGFTGTLIAFAFHGDEGHTELVLALALLAVGTGLAPFAVRPARRVLRGDLPLAALGLLILAGVASGNLARFPAAAALAAAVGFLGAAARIGFDASVQERLAPEVRGRAYARYETILQLGWVAGAAAGSLLELPVTAGSYVVAGIAAAGLAAAFIAGRAPGAAVRTG